MTARLEKVAIKRLGPRVSPEPNRPIQFGLPGNEPRGPLTGCCFKSVSDHKLVAQVDSIIFDAPPHIRSPLPRDVTES
jgi:hypothetical protein